MMDINTNKNNSVALFDNQTIACSRRNSIDDNAEELFIPVVPDTVFNLAHLQRVFEDADDIAILGSEFNEHQLHERIRVVISLNEDAVDMNLYNTVGETDAWNLVFVSITEFSNDSWTGTMFCRHSAILRGWWKHGRNDKSWSHCIQREHGAWQIGIYIRTGLEEFDKFETHSYPILVVNHIYSAKNTTFL
jgi:hypothetical protein